MKNLHLILAIFTIMLIQNCSSQIYLDKVTLDQLVEKKEFTFMAEKANPTNYEVINAMNSMPNATSSRILNLSYGYTIVFKNKEMEVTLPYFGRTFTPSMDPDKSGFRFTSKDYTITKKNGKNDGFVLIIKPNDVKHIEAIYMEINKNGSAYVSVNANDRQPISYSGYIMKNEEEKN